MRIYIDTSVIGGCLDPELAEWSNKLINECKKGKKTAVISDQTFQELEKAPAQVKRLIQTIPVDHLTVIELDEQARLLAMRKYPRRDNQSEAHCGCPTHRDGNN